MTNRAVNPPELYDAVAFGFSHAVRAHGGTLVHLAGQVAWDGEGRVVGPGDLAAQARQVLANLGAVLASQGAGPADVVRLRTYVVDYSPDKMAAILPALTTFYGDATPAANTLIGVQALALPEFLIEIEATAQR
ncbi:enamine deaminase RidA [Rhodothalassium salexigens]|uniref:RidA family protein n=1 Tax=Rhodothalassium salexigens TaxID=1086 RepID=UPI001912A148|nr:RidA family protein [Rhodothalassium salexigens]MBK5911734.1 enamine deaminase RidA [Rhodothalassium salexigens]